jgi:hypothetical protein
MGQQKLEVLAQGRTADERLSAHTKREADPKKEKPAADVDRGLLNIINLWC